MFHVAISCAVARLLGRAVKEFVVHEIGASLLDWGSAWARLATGNLELLHSLYGGTQGVCQVLQRSQSIALRAHGVVPANARLLDD